MLKERVIYQRFGQSTGRSYDMSKERIIYQKLHKYIAYMIEIILNQFELLLGQNNTNSSRKPLSLKLDQIGLVKRSNWWLKVGQ